MRIGFDIGGSHISGALVDNGKIIEKIEAYSEVSWTMDEIIKSIKNIYQDLTVGDLKYVGFGVPGAIDSSRGFVHTSSNLPFANKNLKDIFSNTLGVEAKIENDANCAAYGELLYGRAKGFSDILFITIGTGIGGGIIIDKKIYAGANGFAGEIGHHVIVANGRECSCKKKGCFEAYASMRALVKQAKKLAGKNELQLDISSISGKDIYQYAKAGDSFAKNLINQQIYYLAIGISNLITILQPQIVIVGGGISAQKNYLIDPLEKKIAKNLYGNHSFSIDVASLENNAGVIGAAYL